MANIDTSFTPLVSPRYLYILFALVLLSACAQNEKQTPIDSAEVEFKAVPTGIRTAADGYALRFQEDAIYLQSPDDMDGWSFQIGNSDAKAIQVDSWDENELFYKNIYPNINLRFFDEGKGNAGYDFQVAKGGDPSQICLLLEGKHTPSISATGELILPTEKGEIRHSKPFAYQIKDRKKQFVDCAFTLDAGCLGFAVGEYNRSRKLIIE